MAVKESTFLKVYFLAFFALIVTKLYFEKSRKFSKFTILHIFIRFNNKISFAPGVDFMVDISVGPNLFFKYKTIKTAITDTDTHSKISHRYRYACLMIIIDKTIDSLLKKYCVKVKRLISI